MNVHAAQVFKPPTTSCSPAQPSTLWDARHGPVRWMPTGSFGDWLRHYSRLWTSPYSPDWRSSRTGNTEEEDRVQNKKLDLQNFQRHHSIIVCNQESHLTSNQLFFLFFCLGGKSMRHTAGTWNNGTRGESWLLSRTTCHHVEIERLESEDAEYIAV